MEATRQRRRKLLPRPCAHCGKDFTPLRGRVRYCTPDCAYAARRLHPKQGPRPCAHCGKDFTPRGARVAEGFGLYCTPDCYHESRRIYPDPGPKACDHCGATFTPKGKQVARGGGRYCSYACWGLDRWKRCLDAGVVVTPSWGPAARKKWGRRWGARTGGLANRGKRRKRGYTDDQALAVRAIKREHPSFGRDTIAEMTGTSPKQVRAILAEIAAEPGP